MLINYSKEISKNLRNIAMILPQLTGVVMHHEAEPKTLLTW